MWLPVDVYVSVSGVVGLESHEASGQHQTYDENIPLTRLDADTRDSHRSTHTECQYQQQPDVESFYLENGKKVNAQTYISVVGIHQNEGQCPNLQEHLLIHYYSMSKHLVSSDLITLHYFYWLNNAQIYYAVSGWYSLLHSYIERCPIEVLDYSWCYFLTFQINSAISNETNTCWTLIYKCGWCIFYFCSLALINVIPANENMDLSKVLYVLNRK